MEVGGFVVGVISLASLFNNVIDCFEYVHIGKSFGSNFELYLLKLDNAQLRLSRWGDDLGLSGGGINDATALPSNVWSEANQHKAEQNLGHILEQFSKAMEISKQYKTDKATDSESLTIVNDGMMDPMTFSLHEKIRAMAKKRQNGASLAKKIKFTLYDEKHLKALVDEITNLTNQLVDLFPARKQRQVELAAREVSDLIEPFLELGNAARGQDEDLMLALEKIIKPANNLMTFNTEKSNVGKMGSDTGGHYTMQVGSPW
ncbi:uncharacterized protein ALTATR162_LOCUS443 [Alternaria atra]|uniref:Prion-inhibition and propagation HeLo domain-containing protein n=1 Tax=Alternaria atra TaxID=119953 RepID=A0A8J2HU29_9PLEO|nr:uncharacterized protein ALTATR162_LOCUS443 [Alternaria atra]CAG5138807.1 unnamed protein product [Alternaria atra]